MVTSRRFVTGMLLAGALIIAACDAGSAMEEEVALQSVRLTGALNADFEAEESDIRSWVNVAAIEDARWLDLAMEAVIIGEGEAQERVTLVFRIPFEDDFPEPGTYRFKEAEKLDIFVAYTNVENARSFAEYQLKGLALDLIIEQVTTEQMVGRFALRTQQTQGIRSLSGQIEEVDLALGGQVRVEGIFSTDQVRVTAE